MGISRALFSSHKSEWETPPELFNPLNDEFHFTLDVCATPLNTKCQSFYTKQTNGLVRPWTGTCWCNPPYGREIAKWTQRAALRTATTTVLLIPARTDTKWWHDHIMAANEIHLIKGRVRFLINGKPAPYPAPFPSAIAVFRKTRTQLKVSSYER